MMDIDQQSLRPKSAIIKAQGPPRTIGPVLLRHGPGDSFA